MEESKDLKKLHSLLHFTIYFFIAVEFCVFVYLNAPFWGIFSSVLVKTSHLKIYDRLIFSKLFTFLLICLVSIGTLAKKDPDINPKTKIIIPLTIGLLLFFGSLIFYNRPGSFAFAFTTWYNLAYIVCSLLGAVIIGTAMDNVSKLMRSGLGKDKWNVEGESFMQQIKPVVTEHSVNIPTLFYYKKKVHNGYINIVNPYRGTLVVGTPGSGKTFSIINPFIRQLIAKEFSVCVYDFKFPDLGKIAYYHYLKAKQSGKLKVNELKGTGEFQFHVINLNEVEKSRRTNPLKSDYIRSLADATETGEALVQALKKGDSGGGADAFFTQSAVNFLSCCIYFLSRYQGGKYSSLPHVLALLNCSYEQVFAALFSDPELIPLLSPFKTAYDAKAFNQLEGQIGTLKIFISRLATKETYWVFSDDDFDLMISNKKNPSILVLANNPSTQNINSACYSVVLNRLTRLINDKGNNPSAIIIDELPTLFVHKIENLIATARSNKVAVLMGLQEVTQFNLQYGKETAASIVSIIGNVLSGSVRNKDTLDWLEKLFGKSMQKGEGLSIDRAKTSTSLNEKLEMLIPAGKIASLNAGEMVGIIAADAEERYSGKFETSAVNCKINLDLNAIKHEEDNYKELPVFYDFKGKKEETLRHNFNKINQQILDMVSLYVAELNRT
ncbi:type IV secretion system DNA-binding domain-containing protein [Mucilaginibacter lappiensis]|uniref:YWFCY domain-containing protein n=1 Tax=Mucilaginibacter lappiensis TaxID=354630 RepID=A0A841JJZ0_9SPHI|nr:type IV secretion system DNA-binding domain-containing protein [Mucilaginibacter lappiensis]MBB6131503.1 hypothetical protein [Mucilaginibacter lappiensis]